MVYFPKDEDDLERVIMEAGSLSERALRRLGDLNVPVKMAHPKKGRVNS